jgi:hypothetical protein
MESKKGTPPLASVVVISLHTASPRIALLWKATKDAWLLNVDGLYDQFVAAIHAFEADVRRDPDLRSNFLRMFRRYGWLQEALEFWRREDSTGEYCGLR